MSRQVPVTDSSGGSQGLGSGGGHVSADDNEISQ